MKRYFLYKILPKVFYIVFFLFLMWVFLGYPKPQPEPTYSVTNVLTWMLTPPN